MNIRGQIMAFNKKYICRRGYLQVVSILLLLFAILNTSNAQDSKRPKKVIGPSGQVYGTVRIGDQVRLKENLKTERFKNGDLIKEARTPEQWQKARYDSMPAWSHYDNRSINGEYYGKLYNWHAVSDPRGICPEGWRIPNEDDWKKLMVHLGMPPETYDEFGWRGAIAPSLTSLRTEPEPHPRWDAPNEDATNSSGFSALPGGYRVGNPNYDAQQENLFRYIGKEATFWSGEDRIAWGLWTDRKEVFKGGKKLTRGFGFSVRCIKN
ncbi:MAG: fibrobacter succinogenes major paralogous domain-containing protein [Saprospiraceae bacterium]|nr:fibrobacter succinogenes major paralogous domain-containing protein [Saprospiraceae bacterium]